MRSMTENELTEVVLKRYGHTPNLRLREILRSLIRHAHAFVRETNFTEHEWMEGVQFLTATGQKCDDKRQEMIFFFLIIFAFSALVNMVSAKVPAGATETTVIGPFYVPNSPKQEWGQSILRHPTDELPLMIHGAVRDEAGKPIPNAAIEVWQTNSNGMYDIQDPDEPQHNLRGYYTANHKGEFLIRTIRPTSYPIPTDGPVGVLLRATDRHPWRPAHVHAIVAAKGYQTLTTHLFNSEDKYSNSDVVFAVKNP